MNYTDSVWKETLKIINDDLNQYKESLEKRIAEMKEELKDKPNIKWVKPAPYKGGNYKCQ